MRKESFRKLREKIVSEGQRKSEREREREREQKMNKLILFGFRNS